MTVALAPYRFVNGDLACNLAQIERGLADAKGKADLVCFAESFLQGFDALNWDYTHDREIAVTQDSPVMTQLCAMTVRYGVDLCLGYFERAGERIYSSCALISAGKLLHNYRRISIGWKEYTRTDDHYCEGETSADFDWRGVKLRIALCGDLWEYPDRFATDGLLLWPVYVNFSAAEWEQYADEYAAQAALAARCTLMVNAISHAPDSIGGAFAFADRKIADRAAFGEERLLYVEV